MSTSGPTGHPAHRCVRSGDVGLAVTEHSAPSADGSSPTVVLVHGYPDDQSMWLPVVGRLTDAGLHVVTYDVRGAGRSDRPGRREDYQVAHLVDDLAAVLDAVLPPGGRAHLVGHDWGSVQLWDAVAVHRRPERLAGRVASFTSVSGPSLDHASHVMRHPDARPGRRRLLRRQARRSWYVAAFQLPVLPELGWRLLHRRIAARIARTERLDASHFGPGLLTDAVAGLELYRANLGRGRPRRLPRDDVRVDVPVLVVHPTYDAFLTPVLLEGVEDVGPDVRVVELPAGHWVARSRPDDLARLVREHVRRCEPR